jgi:hypothetical protein
MKEVMHLTEQEYAQVMDKVVLLRTYLWDFFKGRPAEIRYVVVKK